MRLTHVRLLVEDFAGCFRFYRDVLGLEATFGDADGGYADFRAGDVELAIFARSGMDGVVPLRDPGDAAIVILRVDDVDAEADRLRNQGVRFASLPHDQPDWGIRVAHLRDPDGNLIELYRPL